MIYKFDKEQYKLIKRYVKSCCEAEGTKEYIHNEIIFDDTERTVTVSDVDIKEFMSAADDAIIHFGMVNQDCLNDLGCKLQFLYDEIYYQTKSQIK